MPKTFNNLFLSIGAMKAGTTWLYSVLLRHPQLHFAMEKEIHYFYHRYVNSNQLSEVQRLSDARNRYILRFDPTKANTEAVRRNLHWVSDYLSSPVDDFWYRNLFHLRGQQTYGCDFSNLNAQLPAEAWPQIAAKSDKLRVLYTMRDPVKRLWSHTKFHLQVTGEIEKLNTWGPQDFEKFVRLPHIWSNAEYGQVLRNLRGGLAPEMYKIMFYENLHADQRGALRQIEEFLGVPAFEYPQGALDRRPTQSVQHEMPPYFAELFQADIQRIRGEIEAEGFELPAKWG